MNALYPVYFSVGILVGAVLVGVWVILIRGLK